MPKCMEQRQILHIVGGSSRSRAEQSHLGFALGHHCEIYAGTGELIEHVPDHGIILAFDDPADGGVARVLRKESPDTKIILTAPANAALVTSGHQPTRAADGAPAESHPAWQPHPIQGWTPDFIPFVLQETLDGKLYDELMKHNDIFPSTVYAPIIKTRSIDDGKMSLCLRCGVKTTLTMS